MFLQDHDVDPGPRHQETQDHPGRTAAGDATLGVERSPLYRTWRASPLFRRVRGLF